MKLFVIIVNGFHPLIIIAKCSILDVSTVLDSPLLIFWFQLLLLLNFKGLLHLTTIKLYLHHSRLTGKIHGYAHDFCSLKVRENQNSCYGRHMTFLVLNKTFLVLLSWMRLAVWKVQGTKYRWLQSNKY